jgi:hypothetical protein
MKNGYDLRLHIFLRRVFAIFEEKMERNVKAKKRKIA